MRWKGRMGQAQGLTSASGRGRSRGTVAAVVIRESSFDWSETCHRDVTQSSAAEIKRRRVSGLPQRAWVRRKAADIACTDDDGSG